MELAKGYFLENKCVVIMSPEEWEAIQVLLQSDKPLEK